MSWGLRVPSGWGKQCLPGSCKFMFSSSAEPEVIQQKAQSSPRVTAAYLGPADSLRVVQERLQYVPRLVISSQKCLQLYENCHGEGSQRVTRVEQVEFTRPMQIQICSCVEEGSTQARWHLSIGCKGGGLNTKIMVAVYLGLALKPHSPVYPCLRCLLSHCPSARAQSEYLQVSESVCGPFKRISGFPTVFHLSQMESPLIFTDKFCSASFWHQCSGIGILVLGCDASFIRGDLQS